MSEATLSRASNYINNSLIEVNETYARASKVLAEIYAYKIQEDYDILEMLRELRDTQSHLSVKTVGLVDLKNLRFLDNSERILTLDLESERDQWIQDFIDSPQEYRQKFYDPDISEYETLYSFFHDHKIRDQNDQVIGIFGIGLGYDAFYDKIQGLDQTANIYFLNHDGEIRLPKKLKGQSILELYGCLDEQLLEATQGQNQIVWSDCGENNFLLYLHHLKDVNRLLLLEMNVSQYYEQYQMQYFYSFLLGLFLTIIAVVINLAISVCQSNKLSHSAFFDSLTQCRNRNYLESQIKKTAYWRHITQSGYVLILFDIDRFKGINDTYGHAKGDEVLIQVATIAKNCIRDSDEFIRLGGDEFVILLHMNTEKATHLAQHINQQVGENTIASLSMGITEIVKHDTFETAIARADRALYVAKKNGRNQIQVM